MLNARSDVVWEQLALNFPCQAPRSPLSNSGFLRHHCPQWEELKVVLFVKPGALQHLYGNSGAGSKCQSIEDSWFTGAMWLAMGL
jgi:hypothetical protein